LTKQAIAIDPVQSRKKVPSRRRTSRTQRETNKGPEDSPSGPSHFVGALTPYGVYWLMAPTT
jgi:hypothetical protein